MMQMPEKIKNSQLIIAILIMAPCLTSAQPASDLKDENLIQSMPSDYQVAYQNKQNNVVMVEFIPKSETLANWQQMITTNIYLGAKTITLDKLQNFMATSWLSACKDGKVIPLETEKQNGYQTTTWLQTCPLNPTTNKPEHTVFKALKGNDSFYLVQKAFKYQPTQDELNGAITYLKQVYVCDTRLEASPCLAAEKTDSKQK